MGKKKSPRVYRSNVEKVKILREHLLEGVAISELCERHSILPGQFYKWQKQLFENGAAAFGPASKEEQGVSVVDERKLRKQVLNLEGKLRQRDEVVSELMTDHIALKKSLGVS
jgi:transposase-like protein